jgi:hypothetical protein
MRPYEMEFYNASNGVVFRMRWASAEHFRLGQIFLRELVGPPSPPDKKLDVPESYYLPDANAYEALLAFRRKLRKEHNPR